MNKFKTDVGELFEEELCITCENLNNSNHCMLSKAKQEIKIFFFRFLSFFFYQSRKNVI